MAKPVRLRLPGFGVLALSLLLASGASAQNARDAWTALGDGGHVALIRHANAPPGGGGDPPGFKIGDCATQRNLDALGREEAQKLGEAFRQRGVQVGRLLSSPWCRCVDTARLMDVGPVETSWALVPDASPNVSERRLQLKALVAAWRGPGTLVLITHAVTVRMLLGFLPRQGEIVVVKPGADSPAGGNVVGRIWPP